MNDLPGKITDTYLSPKEQDAFTRFLKLLLRFLLLTFGGAAFIQMAGNLSLFYFHERTDIICTALYATAVFACILTNKGKAPAANDNAPQ